MTSDSAAPAQLHSARSVNRDHQEAASSTSLQHHSNELWVERTVAAVVSIAGDPDVLKLFLFLHWSRVHVTKLGASDPPETEIIERIIKCHLHLKLDLADVDGFLHSLVSNILLVTRQKCVVLTLVSHPTLSVPVSAAPMVGHQSRSDEWDDQLTGAASSAVLLTPTLVHINRTGSNITWDG